MQRIKQSRKIQLGILAVLVTLIGMNVYQYSYNQQRMDENFGVVGSLNVYVNGHQTVHGADTIVVQAYEYIGCKIFNFSGSLTGCTYSDAANPCSIGGIGQNGTRCNIVARGFVLSTSGASPSIYDSVCPSATSANGFGAALATVTHTVNTNQYTLSYTWTATGPATISKICLTWVEAIGGSFIAPSTANGIYAETLFPSSQTLSSGQQLTVQWTFNF